MTLPKELRKWLEILGPLLLLGGVGVTGLEFQSSSRYVANEHYVDQVSMKLLEMELRYNAQIAALRERIARLEGTHRE